MDNNISLEKIFEEIGRLHVQILIKDKQILYLQAELEGIRNPSPKTDKPE